MRDRYINWQREKMRDGNRSFLSYAYMYYVRMYVSIHPHELYCFLHFERKKKMVKFIENCLLKEQQQSFESTTDADTVSPCLFSVHSNLTNCAASKCFLGVLF